LSCETDDLENLFFFQHERGEEKNCFLNPTIEQVVVIRRLYKSRKKNLLSFSLFFGVFNNLGAPGLLRWSPEMSTDALCRNDRKPENSVRTVTFCFLIVLLLHGVGVGQG
jgi:hypothetical protein